MRRSLLPGIALAVSLLFFGGGVFFHVWYSRLPTGATVAVGEPAPDFTLPDARGQAVTLSSFKGQKTVVLVFYRGYW
ncbi:MAG: redoxin domain-containing protein [Candidatus Rokubacteria bacterium]|nr:redoxin domain-containing protein [Candidatus Rokubacteria bacterium]